MKRSILLFACILIGLKVFGQEGERLSFGVRAGANLSNQYYITEDDINQLFKPCLQGGVYVVFPASNRVKKELSLNIIERGAITHMESIVRNSEGYRILKRDTSNVSYLYLSLGLKDRLYLSKHFYLTIGGDIEWGIKGRGSSTLTETNKISDVFEGDADLLQKRWDVVASGGLGIDIGRRINIEYNASFGLVNISRSINSLHNVVFENHNYGMSLTLGFRF